MSGVFPPKANALDELFGVKKPIIGMLHLRPLPGASRYAGQLIEEIIELALHEAADYQAGGVDGLMVENQGDLPFAKPEDIGHETVAAMTAVAQQVVKECKLPIGVNCLSNAAIPALAIAKASGALFIRASQWANAYVGNSGLIEGAAPKALRYRSFIRAENVRVFSDVHVKHGSHAIVADRPVAEMARDAVWFDSDVLIASGNRTGEATPVGEIEEIKSGANLPVIVGSGLDVRSAAEILKVADGAIVGTSLKQGGLWWNPVDKNRVFELMDLVNKLRS